MTHSFALILRLACTILLIVSMALCFQSCAEDVQSRVRIPLYVAGVDQTEVIEAKGGVQLTLSRAELAFGALYFCAGTSAGDLCQTARLEWLNSARVNTLKSTPQAVGTLTGVTGVIRSWMYDLGLSSQLTSEDPIILSAAEQLGGYSFVVEGEAKLNHVRLPFVARIQIQQTDDTELGVPVIRKSSAEPFEYDITAKEQALLLRFDPRLWLQELDLRDQLLKEEETNLLEIQESSEAYRALRNALLTQGRPTFTWNFSP